MTEHKCVEPAKVGDYPSADYVCVAGQGESFYFPAVDSCLAVVWILDETMIGGHVPLVWNSQGENVSAYSNALTVFCRMSRELPTPNAPIDTVVAAGERTGWMGAGWKPSVDLMLEFLKPKRTQIFWTGDVSGGVDVRLNRSSAKLSSSRTKELLRVKDLTVLEGRSPDIDVSYKSPELFAMAEKLATRFPLQTPFPQKDERYYFGPSLSVKARKEISELFIKHKSAARPQFTCPLTSSHAGEVMYTFAGSVTLRARLEIEEGDVKGRYLVKAFTPLS